MLFSLCSCRNSSVIFWGFLGGKFCGETLKGLYLKGLLSKHRSIACPLPLALASDLPCGVCTCKWDLQLPSPVWLWTDFPRPRGWRVTTALGNPFPCRTALGNPFPCRKVCFAQEAPLDKPPLRLPDFVRNLAEKIAGFFRTHKTKAQEIRGKFQSIFRANLENNSQKTFRYLLRFYSLLFRWTQHALLESSQFVALFCLEKQCSGLFRYFFVVFSWLFRGPCFGQILRVLALEQSSEILREFFGVIDYAKVSQSPQKQLFGFFFA